ncbi:caspase family protein [Labrys wisconsinensis]|uniref:Caspase-like protein n=1 Tax=Labrys wisconsinensis TaxID=425677 RepID=A0ABU0J8L4_9HYPH|nr:caspase family protein [Labrys wisconsinensis]MDQ0469768.1 putative caspase-like protein [Labrys wisconsinensis]
MKWLLGLVITALILFGSVASASAGTRVALLIANSAYERKLVDPASDVALLQTAFKTAGFDLVDTVLDLGRDGMIQALRSFQPEAAKADIAVIYYSGYAMHWADENYLIPVDAKLARVGDIEDEAISLDRVLETLDEAKTLKLVLLDACRENPFLLHMKHAPTGLDSVLQCLVPVEAKTPDALVVLAGHGRAVAVVGDGRVSPFADALARRLIEPGVALRRALDNVRNDVLAATGQRQEPFAFDSSADGRIFLGK